MLPDFMSDFIKQYGEPQHRKNISRKDVEKYRGRISPALLEFWIDHGQGSYLDGKFWLCDPDPLFSVLQTIFQNDPEYSPSEMFIYAYSAFGHCWVWHPKCKILTIDFVLGQIFPLPKEARVDPITGKEFADRTILGSNFQQIATYEGDCDEQGDDLLAQAIPRLGMLNPGEMYGFFPPPCFGGSLDVASLQKTPVVEHLNFLAQVCDFNIVRLTEPDAGNPFGQLVPVRRPGSL